MSLMKKSTKGKSDIGMTRVIIVYRHPRIRQPLSKYHSGIRFGQSWESGEKHAAPGWEQDSPPSDMLPNVAGFGHVFDGCPLFC